MIQQFNVFVSRTFSACDRGERWGGVLIYWPLRLAQRDDGIYGPSTEEGFRTSPRLEKSNNPKNGDGIRIGYQAY